MLLCGVDACVLCEIDRVMLDGMFVRFVFWCVCLFFFCFMCAVCDLVCDVVWVAFCLCVLLFVCV